MLYLQEKDYRPNFLLLVKNFLGTKFKIPNEIAVLLKRFFKRTIWAFNPQSWTFQDIHGPGRWHLEREKSGFTLHYDKFSPEGDFQSKFGHFSHDLSLPEKTLMVSLLLIGARFFKEIF